MNEQFADVKVRDKVWSINYGWGEVIDAASTHFKVSFENENAWFAADGKRFGRGDVESQTLFWGEIIITPPPKPKREVVHEIERWLNIYSDADNCVVHGSETRADLLQYGKRIACVKLTGTYTTWED